jgi:hypothetical protein
MQVLDIQGYSYEQSDGLLKTLNRGLVTSGGWIIDRRPLSSTSYEFTLEIELRFSLDLYAGIIASGVELTRANHLAFTDLCTCRLHMKGTNALRQIVGIRLEVCFLNQQGSNALLHHGCSAA